jgi:hypothetical protein
MGDRARAGDGVVGAAGRVNGRPVFAYAQDTSFVGGALGAQHADTIVRVLELAGQARAPVGREAGYENALRGRLRHPNQTDFRVWSISRTFS